MSPKKKLSVLIPSELYDRVWEIVLQRAKDRGKIRGILTEVVIEILEDYFKRHT